MHPLPDPSAQPSASPNDVPASPGVASSNQPEPTGNPLKKASDKKGGRPAKDPQEKLTKVTMYVSPRVYVRLYEGAGVLEVTISEFAGGLVEGLLTRRKVKFPKRSHLTLAQENQLTQLAGGVNNLNQLARAANRDGYAVAALEVEKVCDELRGLLSKMARL
ncbi:MobC family plasmid mobilization relaxosome protein [Hymenobacter artigasi]|uniref:Bacterial mobilisation domain-containing protein n=1 Tax=Hymenobacter artigasi TaxID=2719616 RepID=A0ABX1HN88_9BACT|nr:MobC family plasmid mobilization relaxosome protein [Hymenobacter artigasi]NKI91364.1 hypothetical protein [Hymenobacter artigasi]